MNAELRSRATKGSSPLRSTVVTASPISVGSFASIAPAFFLIGAGAVTYPDRALAYPPDAKWVSYQHKYSPETASSFGTYLSLAKVSGPANDREEVIDELWRASLLKQNWDGEGAQAPNAASIRDAVSFVRLLDQHLRLPEAMLHPSGRAGLFWNDEGVYADLEFTGNQLVTYYIERDGGKHKGVVSFDGERMPRVFSSLLVA